MKQFSSFDQQTSPFPSSAQSKLRLRLMAQLRRTSRWPRSAFRQRWRRWHTLHQHRWRRKPSVYVPLTLLQRTPRDPGNFYIPFPPVLALEQSPDPHQRTTQRLQWGSLQLRWFWRRGYGAKVLRHLRQRRSARRHPRWRRDFQKKRSLDRRKFWADRRQMPPRRLGSPPSRRRRRFSPAISLDRRLLPRQRRESRRQPWRMTPLFEPRLTRRLPRERAPTVFRNPGRRSHYPWLRVYGPDRGVLSTVGREEFEPRWRSARPCGPPGGRRGRLFTQNRRLVHLKRPVWNHRFSRSWNYCSGRYALESRFWQRLLHSGIHAMRQIQKKRSVPLGQLERLQRRREGLPGGSFRNLFRRQPERLGHSRYCPTPPAAPPEAPAAEDCADSAEESETHTPARVDPLDRPLWTAGWLSLFWQKRRNIFSQSSPEQREALESYGWAEGAPRRESFPDGITPEIRALSKAAWKGYQKGRRAPALSGGPPPPREFISPPSYQAGGKLRQRVFFRDGSPSRWRRTVRPGFGPNRWHLSPRLYAPTPVPVLSAFAKKRPQRRRAAAVLKKLLGNPLFGVVNPLSPYQHTLESPFPRPAPQPTPPPPAPPLPGGFSFFRQVLENHFPRPAPQPTPPPPAPPTPPVPALSYRSLAERRSQQRALIYCLTTLERNFRLYLERWEYQGWSRALQEVRSPPWENPSRHLHRLWRRYQDQEPPFGGKPRPRSFRVRTPFALPVPPKALWPRIRLERLVRALVRIYHLDQLRYPLYLEQCLKKNLKENFRVDPRWANHLRRWARPWVLPALALTHPWEGLRLCQTHRRDRRRQQVAEIRHIFGSDHPYLPRDPLIQEPREALENRLAPLGETLEALEWGVGPLPLQMRAVRHHWFARQGNLSPLEGPTGPPARATGSGRCWGRPRRPWEFQRGLLALLSCSDQRRLLALYRESAAEAAFRRKLAPWVAAYQREYRWYTQELGLDPNYLMQKPFFRFPRFRWHGWSGRSPNLLRFFRGFLLRKGQRALLVARAEALGARRAYRRRWSPHRRRLAEARQKAQAFAETRPPGNTLLRTQTLKLLQGKAATLRKETLRELPFFPENHRRRQRRFTRWTFRREYCAIAGTWFWRWLRLHRRPSGPFGVAPGFPAASPYPNRRSRWTSRAPSRPSGHWATLARFRVNFYRFPLSWVRLGLMEGSNFRPARRRYRPHRRSPSCGPSFSRFRFGKSPPRRGPSAGGLPRRHWPKVYPRPYPYPPTTPGVNFLPRQWSPVIYEYLTVYSPNALYCRPRNYRCRISPQASCWRLLQNRSHLYCGAQSHARVFPGLGLLDYHRRRWLGRQLGRLSRRLYFLSAPPKVSPEPTLPEPGFRSPVPEGWFRKPLWQRLRRKLVEPLRFLAFYCGRWAGNQRQKACGPWQRAGGAPPQWPSKPKLPPNLPPTPLPNPPRKVLGRRQRLRRALFRTPFKNSARDFSSRKLHLHRVLRVNRLRCFHRAWVQRRRQRKAYGVLRARNPDSSAEALAEAFRTSREPQLYESRGEAIREKLPSAAQRVRNLPPFGSAPRTPPPDPFAEEPLPSVDPPIYAPVFSAVPADLAEALVFWGQSPSFENPPHWGMPRETEEKLYWTKGPGLGVLMQFLELAEDPPAPQRDSGASRRLVEAAEADLYGSLYPSLRKPSPGPSGGFPAPWRVSGNPAEDLPEPRGRKAFPWRVYYQRIAGSENDYRVSQLSPLQPLPPDEPGYPCGEQFPRRGSGRTGEVLLWNLFLLGGRKAYPFPNKGPKREVLLWDLYLAGKKTELAEAPQTCFPPEAGSPPASGSPKEPLRGEARVEAVLREGGGRAALEEALDEAQEEAQEAFGTFLEGLLREEARVEEALEEGARVAALEEALREAVLEEGARRAALEEAPMKKAFLEEALKDLSGTLMDALEEEALMAARGEEALEEVREERALLEKAFLEEASGTARRKAPEAFLPEEVSEEENLVEEALAEALKGSRKKVRMEKAFPEETSMEEAGSGVEEEGPIPEAFASEEEGSGVEEAFPYAGIPESYSPVFFGVVGLLRRCRRQRENRTFLSPSRSYAPNLWPSPCGRDFFAPGGSRSGGGFPRRPRRRKRGLPLPGAGQRRTRRCRLPRISRGLCQKKPRRSGNPLGSVDRLRPQIGRKPPLQRIPRGLRYVWFRLPQLPRKALPLRLYQARRKALWRRGLPRSRRVALKQLAHIYPGAVLRRLSLLRRPAEPARSAFRRMRRRGPRRRVRWPRGRPSNRRREHQKWLPAEGRSRWPAEWSLHRRRPLVDHRRYTDRQRSGWSRLLAHWRRRRCRDRRWVAGGFMARRRGRGGGYRLWRSRFKKKRLRGRYFRLTVGLREGKLRLRELRGRWRYPTAVAPLRSRPPRHYLRPPLLPASSAEASTPFRRSAVTCQWGRHPLHGFRIPQKLYHYWWRSDCHSSWSRRLRAAGVRRRRRKRTSKIKMIFRQRRQAERLFRRRFLGKTWFTG